MDKRQLGDSGISISPIGLGTTKFGRNQGVKYPHAFDLPNESDLANFISLAKEMGVNAIDTAPAYGLSEERLGRLLAGQREDWVIIGKAGEEFEAADNGGQSSYNFTPAHFEASLMRSLKRLNTDYIDVFLIHSDGNDMDILARDDLIETMLSFKQRGVVRAIGASTKTPEGGIKALELMDVVMASYNPDYRNEESVLDYAAAHNKGVLLKKTLSSGHASSPEDALRFALSHAGVSSAIVGTINPNHLKANIAAL